MICAGLNPGSILGICLLPAAAVPAGAQAPSEQTASSHKFLHAELMFITVQPSIVISDEYVKGTQVRIGKALDNTKHFDEVARSTDASASEKSTLRVTPTITRFVGGNRAERYLIGFGAGATKLTIHFVFSDAETGKLETAQERKFMYV